MNAEWIDRLRDPSAYPERPDSVDLRQTHLSIVCLAGDAAYKLKKPVHFPFADFSSASLRRRFCEDELRLNRRLCPGVYLAVTPLRQSADGRLSFCPDVDGEIVDHAVKMRRLPEDRMLDRLLEINAATKADIQSIARAVVAFHRAAERGPAVNEWGDPDKLRAFALANFAETRAQAGAVFPAELHAALESRTRRDFDRCLPTLRRRLKEGRVVDGHGDLHARNICLTDPPAIFDCIEFCASFRCGDVATEHAFLAMDLRYRGHPELAGAYLDAAVAASRDDAMRGLMPPLIRYRALVRAKVCALAAGEEEFTPEARAGSADAARRYLRLAAATAIEEDGPWWLAFCGLPGSGKSSIAECLVRASGGAWPLLATDRIRKELAGIDPEAPLPLEFYSPEFSRRTYDELRHRAAALTGPGKVIVLDANFRESAERSLAREWAARHGARLALLTVTAGEETIIARLDRRASTPGSISDADRAVFEKLRAQFEIPHSEEADRRIEISGDIPPDSAADTVLAADFRSYPV